MSSIDASSTAQRGMHGHVLAGVLLKLCGRQAVGTQAEIGLFPECGVECLPAGKIQTKFRTPSTVIERASSKRFPIAESG